MNRRLPWLRQMWRGARFALPLLLLFLVGAGPAMAQGEENQAGLVIVESDGSVVTRCVSFSEAQISGLTLLERSGLSFSSDAGPVGARVCSINGDGCPSSDCWCQCKGLPCAYWNYYRQNADGSWSYASIGAAMRQLGNGDVDGWVWGDGTALPPAMSFDTICNAPAAPAAPQEATPQPTDTLQPATTQQSATTPQATATLSIATATVTATSTLQAAEATVPPSSTPRLLATPTEAALPTATASATATPQPSTTFQPAPTTSPPSPTPSNTATPEGTSSSGSNGTAVYGAYAAILALLGGTLLVLRRRQRGRRGGPPER